MISQDDMDELTRHWQNCGLFPSITPQQIAAMVVAIQPQPQVPQGAPITLTQSKGRAMRSRPPIKQEITCEFKRVEKSMRPYRGMAYRITVHIPHDMRLSPWEANMATWCFNQWGHAGRLWRNDRGYFYFDSRQKAAMFKLAWHGMESPA